VPDEQRQVPDIGQRQADPAGQGLDLAVRVRSVAVTLAVACGEVVVDMFAAAAVLQLADQGVMGAEGADESPAAATFQPPLGHHVHRAKGHVAEQHRLGAAVDIHVVDGLDAERVEQGVGPDADKARHAVGQGDNLGTGSARAVAPDEDRAAVAAAEGTNLVVAGDHHPGDPAQRCRQILGVEVFDLLLAHLRDNRPVTVDLVALEDRTVGNSDRSLKRLLLGSGRRGVRL
jgi:hypothetical protein